MATHEVPDLQKKPLAQYVSADETKVGFVPPFQSEGLAQHSPGQRPGSAVATTPSL